MITTEFFTYIDNDDNVKSISQKIKERFNNDYHGSTFSFNYYANDELHNIIFQIEELTDIDDVDTFLCEEISHEYEYYCTISDGNKSKSFYYDEDDEWIYK